MSAVMTEGAETFETRVRWWSHSAGPATCGDSGQL